MQKLESTLEPAGFSHAEFQENPRLKVFENCCRKDLLTPTKPNDYCSYGEKMESGVIKDE